MGESSPRRVQTKHNEVCTHDRGLIIEWLIGMDHALALGRH